MIPALFTRMCSGRPEASIEVGSSRSIAYDLDTVESLQRDRGLVVIARRHDALAPAERSARVVSRPMPE
jgi:hypothetical protein